NFWGPLQSQRFFNGFGHIDKERGWPGPSLFKVNFRIASDSGQILKILHNKISFGTGPTSLTE
ncbi:hypothetical protein EF384_07900, partial [Aerococcus agrisoli]